MSTKHDYHDVDGNPVSLGMLCRREPEWAANRIAELEAEVARLRAALGMSGPYPLHRLLTVLADAVNHLRHDHDCDRDGHELFAIARDRARAIVTMLETK